MVEGSRNSGESGPVIDNNAIINLKAMLGPKSGTLLPELIDQFLKDAENLQIQAHNALRDGKPEDLHRAAHSLKSTSASFGATLLSSFCRELEMKAKTEELAGSDILLSKIRIQFDRAKEHLVQIRDSCLQKL